MRLLAPASLCLLPALSSAFLLPPPNLELTAEQLEQFEKFGAEAEKSVWNPAEVNTRLSIQKGTAVVRTKCIECEKLAGEESDLVFEIGVPDDSKVQLTINDATVFPVDHLQRLKAFQIPQSTSDEDYVIAKEDGNVHTVALGYDLSVEGRPVNHESNERPIIVNLRVSTVDGLNVDDKIDDVQVILTENMASKELEIQKFIFVSPGDPMRKENPLKGCDGIACVLRKLMHDIKGFGRDKLRKFRHGCKGRKHSKGENQPTDAILAGMDKPHGHHGSDHKPHRHPHHHHFHHGHRHGHGHRGFFAGLVRQILVPILVGVGAGMVVGLVGLLIGQVAAALWLKFHRVDRNAERDVEDESAKGLLASDNNKESMDLEAPPAYVHEGIEPVEKE